MSLKPMVKWPGGKSWLVPTLAALYADSGCTGILEPFAGGAAFAWYMGRKNTHLNDSNPYLINLYHQVKQCQYAGLETLWEGDEESYYANRQWFNDLIAFRNGCSPTGALLFLYLNKHGFNGLVRFNRRGKFNVPWGGERNPPVPDLAPYADMLRYWRLTTQDFSVISPEANTFVYCDPPYDEGWTGYSPRGWTFADFKRLARWGAIWKMPVVISNKATERVMSLLCSLGYSTVLLDGPRRISRDGNREPVREVLAARHLDLSAIEAEVNHAVV